MKTLQTFLNKKKNLEEVVYGKNSYLYTKKNRYLDLTGGLTGHAILGWSNPSIEEEIKLQLKKIMTIN